MKLAGKRRPGEGEERFGEDPVMAEDGDSAKNIGCTGAGRHIMCAGRQSCPRTPLAPYRRISSPRSRPDPHGGSHEHRRNAAAPRRSSAPLPSALFPELSGDEGGVSLATDKNGAHLTAPGN